MLLLKSDQILIKFLRTAISVYIQAGQEQFPSRQISCHFRYFYNADAFNFSFTGLFTLNHI